MFAAIDTKKKSFRQLSNVKCDYTGCNKFLKQNLIDKNPDANLCYKHHQLVNGKTKINEEPRECDFCNGAGDLIDHSKINCRTIDIPTIKCPECYGSGQKNI